MTYIRAWMSLKFCQIRLLVSTATDRVLMGGKRCCHFFSAVLYRILFVLVGNDDMHESWEEFEIRPDPTTDCGVIHAIIVIGSFTGITHISEKISRCC